MQPTHISQPTTAADQRGTAEAPTAIQSRQTHALASTTLLVLGGVLLFLTNLFVWVDRTVIDSSGFVSAVDQTLDKKAVQQRLADVITTQVLQSAEYQRFVDEQLPASASAVEPLVRNRAQPIIESAVQEILATELLGDARNTILLTLHTRLIALLEDRSELVEVRDDQLVLDLRDQVERVLDGLGINASSALQSDRANSLIGDSGTIVLVEDAGALRQASWLVQHWDTITVVLLIGSLLAFAGTILLRGDRLHGVFRVAAAAITVGVLTLLLGAITILVLKTAQPDMIVLREFVRDLLSNLRTQSAVLIVLGLVAIVVCDSRVRSVLDRGIGTATAALRRVDSTVLLVCLGIVGMLILLAI